MPATNRSEAPSESIISVIGSNRYVSGGADDAALVAGAQADPRAFGPLYEHYLGPIYRYCLVRLGSPEAAEDATSQVFLKALAGLRGYRGGLFVAWLYQIAHNVVLDTRRRRSPADTLELAGEPTNRAPTPEGMAIARAEQEGLRLALAQLPEDQRSAIELQLAGWSSVQIAAVLDRSPAAVKMLRLRAITRLRTLLAER